MIAIKIVSTGRCLAQHSNASQHSQQLLQALNASTRNQILSSALLAEAQQRPASSINAFIVRSLSTSTQPTSQKLTTANNQKLVLVARNIYFRQASKNGNKSGKAAFSLSSKNCNAHPYVVDLENQEKALFYPIESVVPTTSSTSSQDISAQNDSLSLNKQTTRHTQMSSEHNSATAQAKVTSNIGVIEEGNSSFYGRSFNKPLTSPFSSGTKLVVLMSWLGAQEKHIEKYREYYLERGYDVLNVKTSPMDVLLPAIGAKKISCDFVKFLTKNNYEDVVLHSFSVGGYQFGEFVIETEKLDAQTKRKILNSIKGVVFDSPVTIERVGIGVSKSITSNKLAGKFLQGLIELYMVLAKNFATQYYEKASEKVWGGPLTCPSLFFYSKDDIVSDFKIVRRLAETWSQLGIQVQQCVFDSSPHVQHFQVHNNQYVNKLQQFLKEIKV